MGLKQLTQALKEWQVAVHALEQGKALILLRKGGIRETGGQFQVQHGQVLLYPTYEHQKPEWLKSSYVDQVQPVPSGWHPEQIRIGSWAEITEVFQVRDRAVIEQLEPFHIWNQTFVRDRLRWKPSQPLYVLLLQVYRLAQPQLLPFSPTYGGCKSWIELQAGISIEDSVPVLAPETYAQQVEAIRAIAAPY